MRGHSIFNTTGLLGYEKSHFLLFRSYLSLNSNLKSALLWYLIRPSCWGTRKLTPCAYSCLQLVFIFVPWFVLMVIFWLYKYPATCLHHLNDKHAHWYSSLSFKAQMKCPTILKVVALPNFEHFLSHYQVGYFLRITLSLATSHVVPNLLIIKLWHCPLGAINLKNVFCERKVEALSLFKILQGLARWKITSFKNTEKVYLKICRQISAFFLKFTGVE